MKIFILLENFQDEPSVFVKASTDKEELKKIVGANDEGWTREDSNTEVFTNSKVEYQLIETEIDDRRGVGGYGDWRDVYG